MGNLISSWFKSEPPPPMVLVPPIFDYPPFSARTRDLDDPNTFVDLYVSNSETNLCLRTCGYYPKYGLGAFVVFPLAVSNRKHQENCSIMGVRYGSENLSLGTTFMPFSCSSDIPICAWLAGRSGRLTAGLKYDPPSKSNHSTSFNDLKNWSCAIGYGLGSSSPLCPSFTFGLELDRASQLTASFYQHFVVQRRVQNMFEDAHIAAITNYIDIGFELKTMMSGEKMAVENSTFQVAACWQINKNFLLKGKLSHLSTSLGMAFKSWWNPSFTFSLTAVRDHFHGTKFGFGLHMENLKQASYERASPNYVMLTPNKQHPAGPALQSSGKPPNFESATDSGNFDRLPPELKPAGSVI